MRVGESLIGRDVLGDAPRPNSKRWGEGGMHVDHTGLSDRLRETPKALPVCYLPLNFILPVLIRCYDIQITRTWRSC